MHVVLINQYYPPDVAPTGLMLEAVAEAFVKDGHKVTVVCSGGGYAKGTGASLSPGQRPNTSEDDPPCVKVIRVGATSFGRGSFVGKLIDYLSFYCGVAWQLATMSHRPDRIVAMTTPPYLSVLVRLLSKLRKADHAHWVMDLYPDVMLAHGMIKPGGVCQRILSGLTRWGFGGDRCASVLSIGPDMANRVRPYLKQNEDTPWVPLWSSGSVSIPKQDEISHLRKSRGWNEGDLVMMYSGNMGLGHLFDEILEVASKVESGKLKAESGKWKVGNGEVWKSGERESGGGSQEAGPEEGVQNSKLKTQHSKLRLVFFGEGKRRSELEQFILEYPDAPVELHGYADSNILNEHLASADVHLVSLRPEWDGAMVPSKLQGIFAVARPVIFIGSEDSSIGQWVLESGGGWVVPPDNAKALEQAIIEASNHDEANRRGRAASQYALENFERRANALRCADRLGC